MLNEAQKRYARKVARKKAFGHIFKEIIDVCKLISVISVFSVPFVCGVYFSVIKDNIKYLFMWSSLYVLGFAIWGIYAGIVNFIKHIKDVHTRTLESTERELEKQNGLEKASTTAKFKE